MTKLSLEEAREMAELTERIATNLKFISDNENGNLEYLDEITRRIAGNLQAIEDDANDTMKGLEDLATITDRITGNLQEIESDEHDLDDLANKTGEIAARIGEIEKAKGAGTI